jgi:hypothetical protein
VFQYYPNLLVGVLQVQQQFEFAFATQQSIPSMSGNSDIILTVFAFRACKSITVCNSGTWPILVPGFGISNIGTVLRALVIFQRPDLR